MPVGDAEKKWLEHDYKLKELMSITHKVAEKVDNLTTVATNQELLLERIANIDEKYRSSIDRVHKRMDELHSHSEDKQDYSNKRIDKVNDHISWVVKVVISKIIILGITGVIMFVNK
jgi:predicted PurR-regulated permease PerM